MNYLDMGHKMPMAEVAESPSTAKQKVSYPKLSLTGDRIPKELAGRPNESMCRLEIVVRKIGDSINTYVEDEPRCVELEVHKMAYIAHAGKATKEEYLKMDKDKQEEYDRHDVGADEGDADKGSY